MLISITCAHATRAVSTTLRIEWRIVATSYRRLTSNVFWLLLRRTAAGHSLDERNKNVRAMRIEPPPGCSLDEIRWDVETLRILIKQTLARCRSDPVALMKAWDKSGDGTLSKRELCTQVRGFMKDMDEGMWQNEVVGVVEAWSRQRTGNVAAICRKPSGALPRAAQRQGS